MLMDWKQAPVPGFIIWCHISVRTQFARTIKVYTWLQKNNHILARDLPSTVSYYSHIISFYLLFFRVFPVLWKIAKIFLDPKTRAKCVVLKSSELHKLCDYFDPDNLPDEFGGTCRCENGCLSPIPKHMVSLEFSEEFSIPEYTCIFRAYTYNLRAMHGGLIGNILDPEMVSI